MAPGLWKERRGEMTFYEILHPYKFPVKDRIILYDRFCSK